MSEVEKSEPGQASCLSRPPVGPPEGASVVGVALCVAGLLLSAASLALGASQWPGVAVVALGAFVAALCHYEGVIRGIVSSEIDSDDVRMNGIHDEMVALKAQQAETSARVDNLSLRRL